MFLTPRQRVESWRRAVEGEEWSGYGDPDLDDLVFVHLHPPHDRRSRRGPGDQRRA